MDLDSDADPNPSIFITDLQDANKKLFFFLKWTRIRIRNTAAQLTLLCPLLDFQGLASIAFRGPS
jgi:hypothetical protein